MVLLRGTAGLAALALVLVATTGAARAETTVDIYHVNDMESALLGESIDGEPHRGAARLVATLDALRARSADRGRHALTLSSGDNFLAGVAREASRRDGTDYDAITLALAGFDAIALGNHDFDFGPVALADFIIFDDPNDASDGPVLAGVPFLSANLDFTGEPRLQTLVDGGQLAASTIVERDGARFGIIGGQTEALPRITTLGAVTVADFADAVLTEAERLAAAGVDKIVLVSHLQGIANDLAFIREHDLGPIDVVIAGGGDELLFDAARKVVGTDEGEPVDVYGDTPFDPSGTPAAPAGPDDTYPLRVEDATGRPVYVVTTSGGMKYVGALSLTFDEAGEIVAATGDPVLVGSDYGEDAATLARVSEPVAAAVAAIASERVGRTETPLESRRPQKRIEEVNLGNLFADAMAWQAGTFLGEAVVGKAVVALQNGGGIRNPALLFADATPAAPATITRADTQSIAPFPNFLAWADDLTAAGADSETEALLAVLRHAVANVENVDGRFLQVSGIAFDFDAERPQDDRVTRLALADGTVLWSAADGLTAEGEEADLALVTNSFTAAGGDGFATLAALPFANLPFTYEEPLVSYIREALDGLVTAERYGGPVGRIN